MLFLLCCYPHHRCSEDEICFSAFVGVVTNKSTIKP